MREYGFAAIGSGLGELECLGEGIERSRHIVEIERVGDADILENVNLAGGELFTREELLGRLVSAQGFDRVAQAAIDSAGVREKLCVFRGRSAVPADRASW